jgi:hypothetical protein
MNRLIIMVFFPLFTFAFLLLIAFTPVHNNEQSYCNEEEAVGNKKIIDNMLNGKNAFTY